MAIKRTTKQEGNSHIRTQTWDELMGSAAFVKGFNDKRSGKPMEYDAFAGDPKQSAKQWHYERGRLFACIYDGQLKDGRRVTYAAKLSCSEAFKDKSMR